MTENHPHGGSAGPSFETGAREVARALRLGSAQQRLQAALTIGTHADPDHLDVLIDRCRTEPDFFVRDMLTWALTRLPADLVVPRLLAELESESVQAQSQALHSLSKIGDPRGWVALDPSGSGMRFIAHTDAEAARSAWRAAVRLVPGDQHEDLASSLVTQLGRGDVETQKSLSRALVALGDEVVSVVDGRVEAEEETVRAHALATVAMFHDPDAGFAHAMDEAKRVVALGSEASA